MNLKEIVNSREFEMFKMFLQSKNALVDVLFWQDLEAYGFEAKILHLKPLFFRKFDTLHHITGILYCR